MKAFQNLKASKSFFRENCFISDGDKKIYFNEIITPEHFKKIYTKEKIKLRFERDINVTASRPFFNIPASLCQKNGIYPNKVIILRINNLKKRYEIVAKVGAWGRIAVSREVINTLNITPGQKTSIEVIKEREIVSSGETNLVSLLKNKENIKIVARENSFVTIYSEGKFPITMPKNVSLDQELIECFFLIHGDGHYQEKLFFSNKESELHRQVIEVFQKRLGIPQSIWKARINLNSNYKNDTAKNFWLNALNLDARQLYPSVSKTKFNTPPQGDLRIVIDYPLVSEIFRSFFTYMQHKLDEDSSFYALNGLLAAEGGAQIEKVGLHRLTLSYNSKERELFKKILRNCKVLHLFKEIKKSDNHGIFVLEGWKKMYPFFKEFARRKIIPFNLHTERKQRAIVGMENHFSTKTLHKYLSMLNENKEFTVRELSKRLQIRKDSCLSTLRKNRYSPFTVIEGRGINRNPLRISITKQGQEFLNFVLELRGWKKCMNRQIFVKKESIGNFGKNPKERTVEELINCGIVNIDKPKGPTEVLLPEFPIRFQTMCRRS